VRETLRVHGDKVWIREWISEFFCVGNGGWTVDKKAVRCSYPTKMQVRAYFYTHRAVEESNFLNLKS